MKPHYICFLLIVLFSCKKEEEFVAPSVKTNNPNFITSKAATLYGELTVKGSGPINDYGFIWSTTPGVSETNGTIKSLGERNETGSFESTLDGLSRGNKYYYTAYVKTNNTFFLGKEIEFTTGVHTITSASPNSVLAGGKVIISGSNFISDQTKINVTVGNFVVPVTTATETQIEVILPVEISGGSKFVSVKIEGIEMFASSSIVVTPALEKISASWGFAGDTIQVSGSGFGTTSEVMVKFNDKTATVTSANFSKISFVVPFNSGGANTFSLSVNSIPLSSSVSFKVPTWKKLTDLPFKGRFASSSFIINNKLYIGFGSSFSNERFSDFWKVDLQSGVATKLKDFPQGGRFASRSFTIGDKGYIMLGYDNTVKVLNELWEYDPRVDSWTMKSPFPGIPRSAAVSFVLNDRVYVGCGIANGITSLVDFYKYDPTSDTWTPVKNFGGGPIYGQGSFVIGDKAYLATGVKNNDKLVRELWEFDGSNWTQRADYPGQLITDGNGFNYSNIGCYGLGGIDSNTPGTENWKYKPSSNTWKKIDNFSGPARFGVVSGSSEKYWYVGLGYLGNTEYKDLWIVELP